MGTILASTLISRARRLLQDQSNVVERWADTSLLDALNEGQSATVILKHDVSTEAKPFQLEPGTLQTLPENSIAFLRLTRNLGSDGATPGRVIRMVTADRMDAVDPDWHATEADTTVLHCIYDPRDNQRFFVWPPAPDRYVELIHAVVPAKIATKDDPITLSDIYAPALTAYMVYSAIAQDMDASANREVAERWYQRFAQLVMGKATAESQSEAGGG